MGMMGVVTQHKMNVHVYSICEGTLQSLSAAMRRESSISRSPQSLDRIKIRPYGSKSLSKTGINTPSPVIVGKGGAKEPKELVTIKERVKRKGKQEKKPNKIKPKKQSKGEEVKQGAKGKKKTNFATCLKELKPVNLQKEKTLFFDSQFQKNPFFVYPNIKDIYDEQHKENFRFQSPHSEYLSMAMRILEKGEALEYWSQHRRGETLSVQATSQHFQDYINELGISELLNFTFQENTISTTSVVHNNVDATSSVVIGLPIRYTQNTVEGVMNHEIGTHFLRKYNDRNQKWFKDRKKYNLGQYLETQEGLAALNQLLPFVLKRTVPPLLYRAAMMYVACYLASQMSFCELFRLMERYQPDPQMRWKECVRVKRGIADTSRPGGMYKDQIYFMGAIKVLRNRYKLNFKELHCGKITVDDCLRLSEKGQIQCNEKCKMPLFLRDMGTYMRCLDYIAQYNEIK